MDRLRVEARLALITWTILTVSVVVAMVAYVAMRTVSDDRSALAGSIGVAMIVMVVLRLRYYHPATDRTEDGS